MQKKIIALAVAGLVSGAAFAQSTVTIYGTADGSFEAVSASGQTSNGAVNTTASFASRTRVQSNNSLIGFKTAESLGNGLTAVAQFETNVNLGGSVNGASTASSALFGAQRDTYVGIAGSFGTVAAGYLSTPTRSTLVMFDVMPGATGAGGINSLLGHVNLGGVLNSQTAAGNTTNTFGTTTAAGVAITNNLNTVFRTTAIAYISPTISGFTGTLAYVPTTARDNGPNNNNAAANLAGNAALATRTPSAWNGSVTYVNGPIKVGYAYLRATDTDVLANAGVTNPILLATGLSGAEKNSTHILGAGYNFGNGFELNAVYDRVNVALSTVAQGDITVTRNAWWLGGKYVVGANEFAASYATIGSNNVGNADNTLGAGNNYGNSGAKQISLRYGYNLSKRTQVYGLYTRVTNDANGNFDVFNGSGVAAANTNAGADPQVIGAGLRHNF